MNVKEKTPGQEVGARRLVGNDEIRCWSKTIEVAAKRSRAACVCAVGRSAEVIASESVRTINDDVRCSGTAIRRASGVRAQDPDRRSRRIESLEALGADVAFGLPGIHALPMWDGAPSAPAHAQLRTELNGRLRGGRLCASQWASRAFASLDRPRRAECLDGHHGSGQRALFRSSPSRARFRGHDRQAARLPGTSCMTSSPRSRRSSNGRPRRRAEQLPD